MRDDIAALLGALSEPLVEELHQATSLMQRVYTTDFIPRCNVAMDSEGYVEVSLEVPGFSRDSLEVSVSNGTLTISGRTSERPPTGSLIRCERFGGSFHRRFRVSPNTQESDITAWHENGLLTIRVSPVMGHPTHHTAIPLENHSHSRHSFTVDDLQRANTSIERSLHQSPPVSAPGSHARSSTAHSSSNRSPRSGSNDCSTGSNRSSSPTGSGSNQRSSSPTGSGQNDGSTGSSGSQDRSSSPTGSPSSLMSSEASSEHNNNGHKRSRRHYEASEASSLSSSSGAAVEKRRRRRDGGSSSGGSSQRSDVH